MFYVRDISGRIAPYSPGTLQRVRTVDAAAAIAPVSGHSNTPGLAVPQHTIAAASSAITAYERAIHHDTPRKRILLVSEMMSTKVITIARSALLAEASRLFASKRFRHVPVVDDVGKLVGILSDRDLLRRAAHIADLDATPKAWREERVDTIMNQPVLVASGDTEMREIARVMFSERIGCLPIVDIEHVLVGIITRSDVLRTLLVQAPLELWR